LRDAASPEIRRDKMGSASCYMASRPHYFLDRVTTITAPPTPVH